MLSAHRERRAYEKRRRDPDDCYLEVMAREEERREQGLPPRIGILQDRRGIIDEDILSISIQENDEEDGATGDPSRD